MTHLTPEQETKIKRLICEQAGADNIQPDEVIVHPDGGITIDRRARYPRATPLEGFYRWKPAGEEDGWSPS